MTPRGRPPVLQRIQYYYRQKDLLVSYIRKDLRERYVGSSAHGAVAVSAEAGATINVSSNATVRVGLRDFMLDVSVTTMLREISARTEPLSVVAMTAQRQVNATTKKQEVAVTA